MKINKILKMVKLNRGKEKITTVANYVKKEANIYCLLLYPEQAEVALTAAKFNFQWLPAGNTFNH